MYTMQDVLHCLSPGVDMQFETEEGVTDHVKPVEDLVAHITADAHVSSPCGSIKRHIGCLIL